MERTFKISDLVMLQMVGGLDQFNRAIMKGENPNDILELTKAKATTPNLFRDIVRKTIETQFAEPTSSLRELGQNARDAYDFDYKPKVIEVSTRVVEDKMVVSFRDYGVGMQPLDVLKNLLIPYNSTKEFDPTKIGEHGMGWFSILDISEKVEVVTRNGSGFTTLLELEKKDGEWTAQLDLTTQHFNGTEVRFHSLSPAISTRNQIKSGLERHLGFSDSYTVKLTLDGEQVNVLDQKYMLAGEAVIRNKDTEGNLRMHVSREWTSVHDTMLLTQCGQFIKDIDNPFGDKTLHHDFFRRLVGHGIHFWADVPRNIGLTKGRNNIIAQDYEKLTEAFESSFEQVVLNKILEDEKLVKKLDHQIAEIVGHIFEKTYSVSKISTRRKLTEMMRRGAKILSSQSPMLTGSIFSSGIGEESPKKTKDKLRISSSGRDYFLEVPPRKKNDLEIRAEEKRKAYISEVTGFSKSLLTKKFIPAIIIQGKGDVGYQDKVSVEDILVAYDLDSLLDLSHVTDMKKPGIYVNSSNAVVKTVLRALERDMSELQKLKAQAEDQIRKRLERDNSDPASHESSYYLSYDLRDGHSYKEFGRIGKKTFKEIVEKENAGREYLAFIEITEYIDELISNSNNIPKSFFTLHSKFRDSSSDNIDLAHTNTQGISFNLAADRAQKYISSIREGKIGDYTMDSLIEVVLHEKTHCKIGQYDEHATHGNNFYVMAKRPMREKLIEYLLKNEIDPLAAINGNIAPLAGIEATDLRKLKTLIDSH